jgi:D-threo-aldose 1-dehydrogenase
MFDPVDEATAVATIARAVELGVGHIDAAPLYGVGLAEERLGMALRGMTARPRISTKVGRVLDRGVDPATIFADGRDLHAVHDLSEAGIRRSLEDSLTRLGLDRVDVALLHDPDDHYEAALTSAFPAMRRLKAEGLVGAIGAGMNQAEMLHRFVDEVGIDIVLLAGRWSLLDHGPAAHALLERCGAAGVEVMIGGVLNSGLLAGGSTFDYRRADASLVARRDTLAAVCAEHGVSLYGAAMQFPLRHPAVGTVLVGARSPAEIEAAAAALAEPIPPALWQALA